MTRDYDSTVARIAGNVAGFYAINSDGDRRPAKDVAEDAVYLARAIVAEVKRTEPQK